MTIEDLFPSGLFDMVVKALNRRVIVKLPAAPIYTLLLHHNYGEQ
jgi:hypothetical protein